MIEDWMQTDFSGGEISPRLRLKISDQDNENGLGVSTNYRATPQGTLAKREGFEYITEFSLTETSIRLFNFEVNFDQSIAVAITDSEISLIDRNGFIPSVELLENPNFVFGETGWANNAQTSFGNGIFTLNQGGYIEQEVNVLTGIKYVLTIHSDFKYATIRIGTTSGGIEIHEEIFGTKTFQVQFTAVADDVYYIRLFLPYDSTAPEGIKYTSGKLVDTVSLVTTINFGDIPERQTFGHPYLPREFKDIQAIQAPGLYQMYFVHRNHAPRILTYDPATLLWTFDIVPFDFGDDGGGPPVANFPPWDLLGTGLQHPGTIEFHQGRLCLGGTYAEPVTVWISGDQGYLDFDIGDIGTQVSGDSLILPLDKRGVIVWLKSNRQLLVGLDTGEHVIFSDTGLIDVDDAQTEQHSAYGSRRIQAINLAGFSLFVNTSGKKIRASNYVRDRQAWVPIDLTYKSEHMSGDGLIELSHGTSPDGFVLAVLENGSLLYGNIEFDQDKIGWHRWRVTGVLVKSITVTHEYGIDIPWVAGVVKNRITILRQSPGWYADSSIGRKATAPTNIWTGLYGLRGRYCIVLADGAVLPGYYYVDANGTLSFDEEDKYTTIVVGTAIGCTLTTLTPYKSMKTGTNHTAKKKFTSIYINVLEGAGPEINFYNTFLRTPSMNMDEVPNVNSEWIEIADDSVFKYDPFIILSDLKPFPQEIRAIGGKLEEHNK